MKNVHKVIDAQTASNLTRHVGRAPARIVPGTELHRLVVANDILHHGAKVVHPHHHGIEEFTVSKFLWTWTIKSSNTNA
jgi:hypothetical protein